MTLSGENGSFRFAHSVVERRCGEAARIAIPALRATLSSDAPTVRAEAGLALREQKALAAEDVPSL